MTTAFAQGQSVRMKIVGFGTTSYEDLTVAKVTDKAVTLKGFKGSFHPLTGESTESFADGLARSIVPHETADKPAKFSKGQKVDKSLTGAGFTTKEKAKVLKVDKKGVWLDNGSGNDPSGPFDAQTGLYLGASMAGWVSRISAAA
jgi:hypothetical protein